MEHRRMLVVVPAALAAVAGALSTTPAATHCWVVDAPDVVECGLSWFGGVAILWFLLCLGIVGWLLLPKRSNTQGGK